VGLAGGLPAKSGRRALADLAAEMLAGDQAADHTNAPPDLHAQAARHVYLSDFLGPLEGLKTAIARAADIGAQGLLMQVLDPAEQDFPFAGRTLFLSMSGQARFDTQSAADLRGDYLQRLAERKDALATLARAYGWDYYIHHSHQPPLGALIWAHQALSQQGANL